MFVIQCINLKWDLLFLAWMMLPNQYSVHPKLQHRVIQSKSLIKCSMNVLIGSPAEIP